MKVLTSVHWLKRTMSSGHGYDCPVILCERSAASQDRSGTQFKLLLKSQYQAKFCLLMPTFVSRSNSNSWPLHISSESPVRQTLAGPVR